MSADRAYMICKNVAWPALGIRDTEIAHCNEAAAKKHGYRSARHLARKRLSEIQPKEAREIAQAHHLLREHGYPADTGYCTIMHAADGEVIGHYRQLVWRLSDGHGGLSYCVEIERVTELAPAAMPDIALYGLTQEHFEHVCGMCTVQQLKDSVRNDNLVLQHAENLRTILARCKQLSMHFDSDDDTGVDVMLSGQVVWTLHGRSPGLVKIWQDCEACGWRWATPEFQAQECPQCRKRMPPRIAGATPLEVAQELGEVDRDRLVGAPVGN